MKKKKQLPSLKDELFRPLESYQMRKIVGGFVQPTKGVDPYSMTKRGDKVVDDGEDPYND